jgi:hypothetical protein
MYTTIIQNGEVDDNLKVLYENGEILNVLNIDTIADGNIMTRIVLGTKLDLDGEVTGNVAEMYTMVLL